jgi:hypothetical protein
MQTRKTTCCGMRELHGLADGRYGDPNILNRCLEAVVRPSTVRTALILFSDAVLNGYGTSLARLLVKNNLGAVVESAIVNNHNSGNDIQAWLWAPDWNNISTYMQKNRRNT